MSAPALAVRWPGFEPQARVLVVEPLEADFLGLAAILDRTRWIVNRVPGRSEAARMLRRAATPVVICERDLPDGTWRDVVALADSITDSPAVIVTARAADERLWAEMLDAGGYDVLVKPFDAREVFRIVSLACRWWYSERRRRAAIA
jgi:DNA-binding response OmpR family regulator